MANTTLDDNSNFFIYGGDTWGTNHTADPLTGKYSNGTFHTTTISGAWARLCWTGTDITIFGAKRENHGLYAAVVDNGDVNWASGFSTQAQIQAVLYSSQGLAQGDHQIVLSNQNAVNATKGLIWFDIDGATVIGTPIDCSSLPDATVTPSGAVATATITSAVSSVESSSSQDSTSSEEASTSADEAVTTTAAVDEVPSITAEVPTTLSTTYATITTSTSSSSSTTSHRPTTTITLDQPNISTSPTTSAQIAGAEGASSSSTNGAGRIGSGVEQIAFFGVLGWYLLRMLQ
ncbi:hypothetical protein IAT38_006834 [Cryptococcus sp. DSM 104549]